MVKGWGALVGITIIATLALILIPYTPQAEAGVVSETICSGDLLSGLYNDVLVETGEICSVRPGAVIQGNLVGEEDSTIALVLATVGGNVEVGINGRFVSFGGTIGGDLKAGDGSRTWLNGSMFIGGDIEASNCFSVGMYNVNPLSPVLILGDVFTDGCDFVRLRNSSIGNSVDIRNTLVATTLADSVVAGSVEIEDNMGTVYRAARNSIGGDLRVNNNDSSTSVLPIPGFISGNLIAGSLDCGGNNPAPVAGIVSGPNVVSGSKSGQCAGL